MSSLVAFRRTNWGLWRGLQYLYFGSPCQGSCLRSRLRGSQKRLYKSIFSPSVTAKPCHRSTAVSVGASKLTLRDCHRQSAPSSEGGKGACHGFIPTNPDLFSTFLISMLKLHIFNVAVFYYGGEGEACFAG